MNAPKWIIPILLILLFSFILWNWLFGFPYEKNNLISEVRRYVETKYELTPTNIQISFSIDGMDSAWVSTEEMPFSFQVHISRKRKKVLGDLFLESLSEFYLEELISKELVSFVDVDDIRVVLENRFSKSDPELTFEEINANPNIILSSPDISYYCSVYGVKIGSENSLLIFNQITEFFNPTRIYFHYDDADGKEKSVCIKANDYNKIHKKEDFVSVIK